MEFGVGLVFVSSAEVLLWVFGTLSSDLKSGLLNGWWLTSPLSHVTVKMITGRLRLESFLYTQRCYDTCLHSRVSRWPPDGYTYYSKYLFGKRVWQVDLWESNPWFGCCTF